MNIGLIIAQLVFIIFGILMEGPFNQFLSMVPTVLMALPVYYWFIKGQVKSGLVYTILISLYATGIEALSVITGFPYGFFTYGNATGPHLFGVVSWAVSFGWVPLLMGSIALAKKVSKGRVQQFIAAVFILVALDLVLDPGAVAIGLWEWKTIGWYYTVPLVNYLGWIVSACVGVGLAFTLLDLQKIPVQSSAILLITNAFWLGVTFFAEMYLAFGVGVVLHVLLLYLFRKTL